MKTQQKNLFIALECKPEHSCNPAFEEELISVLQQLWDSRMLLGYGDLHALKKYINKPVYSKLYCSTSNKII